MQQPASRTWPRVILARRKAYFLPFLPLLFLPFLLLPFLPFRALPLPLLDFLFFLLLFFLPLLFFPATVLLPKNLPQAPADGLR